MTAPPNDNTLGQADAVGNARAESLVDQADWGELAAAKLTALWALSEGGLGGILHATRLPCRGILLASISVISICLISRVSRKRTAALRAVMVVLAIKAVLAPHSVGGAHVAVLNQALLGTLCMLLFGPSLLGCVMVGLLGLIETSLHHLFWATLLGGMDFWASLDQLLIRGQVWLTGQVVIPQPARWMVGLYVGVHAAVGVVTGVIAWRLPRMAERILASRPPPASNAPRPDDATSGTRRRPRRRWVRMGKGIIFVLAVIALAGPGLAAAGHGPWYWRVSIAALRVVCVVAVFVFVIRPVVSRLVDWLLRRGRKQSHFTDTLAAVRALQGEVADIWHRAAGMRLWRRMLHCVGVLFATALVPERAAEQPREPP